MAKPVVAVLDVGKTNKKVALYDSVFDVVAEDHASFESYEWEGLEVENTDAMIEWFRQALKSAAAQHDIRAIAVSAHGATFALLDERGELALPVIAYTSPGASEIEDEFHQTFGTPRDLHRQTCTPNMGFVNMAKVLYYVKTRLPKRWAACKHALFYGTYFGHALTGVRGLEPTFPGNHTYFWDFEHATWSHVARALGADKLFDSPMARPWDALGNVKPDWINDCGLMPECKVTLGIHDSNANYLPYLAQGHKDFLLNSTGTWSVLLRNA